MPSTEKDVESRDDRTASLPEVEKPKVYPIRWLILFLFVFFSASNAMQWIQYTIISNVIRDYYSVSADWVNWTSIIYMVLYIPFIFPGSYLLEKLVGGTTDIKWIFFLLFALTHRFFRVYDWPSLQGFVGPVQGRGSKQRPLIQDDFIWVFSDRAWWLCLKCLSCPCLLDLPQSGLDLIRCHLLAVQECLEIRSVFFFYLVQ